MLRFFHLEGSRECIDNLRRRCSILRVYSVQILWRCSTGRTPWQQHHPAQQQCLVSLLLHSCGRLTWRSVVAPPSLFTMTLLYMFLLPRAIYTDVHTEPQIKVLLSSSSQHGIPLFNEKYARMCSFDGCLSLIIRWVWTNFQLYRLTYPTLVNRPTHSPVAEPVFPGPRYSASDYLAAA